MKNIKLMGRYITLLLVTIMYLGIIPAHAETKRACNRSANVEYRDCARTCNADLADLLLVCSANGNATLEDCFESCAAAKDTCLDPYRETRQDCHDACFIAYDTAASVCSAACTGECASDPVYVDCLDQVLIARFSCDLECRRNNLETKDERKACRQTFKSCIVTCRG